MRIPSKMKSVSLVAITIKTRNFSFLRRVTVLLAVASFLVVCITVRLIVHTFHIMHQGPITLPVRMSVHPSFCNEGPTTNISSTSLSISKTERRRGDYPHYHHMSQIVEGPALTAPNVEHAICKFRRIKYSHHFPHT